MKVNRCCRDNSRGVDSKSRKEGSCARWRRDLKFSGRGLQHIFCHSLSPYPLYISRSRFGQLQQLHRPCAVSLGITTILKNCFRMFTRPLRRFWSRGNPSPPLLPPPPLSLHRCLGIFDANRLRLYEYGNGIPLPSAEFQIAT